MRVRCCCTGIALVAVLLAAGSAVAGTVYAWRTEDGTYAFADDPKKIPPRYRDVAEPRSVGGGLTEYERLTEKDVAVQERYAKDLAQRVEHLRRLNAEPSGAVRGAAPAPSSGRELSLRLGGRNAPELDLDAAGDEAPIVIEDVRVRSGGDIATRHDTVVRQGGRTLVILKGRRRDHSSLDVIDAEEIE